MGKTTLPSRQIRDGGVQTADIADLNVTTAKLAASAVTFSKVLIAGSNPCLEDDGTGAIRVKVFDKASGGTIERTASGIDLALKPDGGLRYQPINSTPPPYSGLYVVGLQNLSSAPTDSFGGTTEGWFWWNTATTRAEFYARGSQTAVVSSVVAQGNTLSGDAIANTTAETTMTTTGTANKYTIPANSIIGSKVFRVTVMGKLSTTGAPTLALRVKIGAATVVDFGAVTMPTGVTDRAWIMECIIAGRQGGVSGNVVRSAKLIVGGINPATMRGTAVAVNTTIDNDMTFTAQWGTASASNSLTPEQLLIEYLN
jgi:hypothetical protein